MKPTHLSNYNNILENSLVIELLDQHAIEKQGLTEIINAVQKAPTPRLKLHILGKLSAVSYNPSTYDLPPKEEELENIIKQIHHELDADYWANLIQIINCRFISHLVNLDKFKSPYVDSGISFSKEAIVELIEKIESYYNIEKLAQQVNQLKSSLIFKPFKNGNLEITHSDIHGELTPYSYFTLWAVLLIKASHENWVDKINIVALDMPQAFELIGVQAKYKSGKYSQSVIMKLNKEMAQKFLELTNITL